MRTRSSFDRPSLFCGSLVALGLAALIFACLASSGCSPLSRYERAVRRTPWHATNLYEPIPDDTPAARAALARFERHVKDKFGLAIVTFDPSASMPTMEGWLDVDDTRTVIHVSSALAANARILTVAHEAAHLFLPGYIAGRLDSEVFCEYVAWRTARALGVRTTLGFVAHVKGGLPALRIYETELAAALAEIVPKDE